MLCIGMLQCVDAGARAPSHDLDRTVAHLFSRCGAAKPPLSPSARLCAQRGLVSLILAGGSPSHFVPKLAASIHRAGGPFDRNCHIYFHWIGRQYGQAAHVTLAGLQHVLPASNDPSCPAGFAHGVLTAIGNSLIMAGPRRVLATCHKGATRYERYSCIHGLGHAYMRMFSEEIPLALRQCGMLGAESVDCAQGVFHDYWFSIHRVDDTSRPVGELRPAKVCERQLPKYVRPCWYRVFMEFPPRPPIRHPADLEHLCAREVGLQHHACITGASAVASPSPTDQLLGCAHIPRGDELDCVRGVDVPAVMGRPLGVQLNLAEACSQLPRIRAACFQWLGRTLNVVTNGHFRVRGCSALYRRDAANCIKGARAYEQPLVTFS